MKNRGGVFLILFVSGLYSLTSSVTPQYHFVNDRKNWTEAQKYCREQYWDLPSIYSIEDMESLTEAVHSGFDGRAWIGLERGILQTWHWSFTDKDFYRHGEFEFRNWKNGEPGNGDGKDSCAAMHPNGEWFDDNCNNKRPFICFDGRGEKKKDFILYNDDKTWREAQTFCRKNHIDLVSVRNQLENQKIQSVLQSQSAWIGLFSDPWRWSDHGNSSFRFWNSKQPNNFGGNQHCVAAVLSKSGRWNDLKCRSSRPFFCQSGLRSKPPIPTTEPVKHIDQTTTDETSEHKTRGRASTNHTTTKQAPDKHTSQNQITERQTTEFKTTHLASTVHPALKSIITEQETTEYKTAMQASTEHTTTMEAHLEHTITEQATTEHTPSHRATTKPGISEYKAIDQASTEDSHPDHTTTKPGTIAHTITKQPLTLQPGQYKTTGRKTSEHTTAEQYTTAFTVKQPCTSHTATNEHLSTGHASNEHSVGKYISTVGQIVKQTTVAKYRSTEHTTTEETANEHSIQDYLILIHENKTWNEALSYCREHHVSLVSVTNAVTQIWVAKKAENASTSHVWLGLRFTCAFNFWFWITPEPGCYQNWAEGHGPGGLGVCGHTGAIESGGAHQWVGLPETERLNFICYTCGGRRH
ncbi:hypothetical protein MATL_G00130640 [Megalops atlanticus]|uniref:C-type lectin domain-containing protein n=1 Tax=Megalops atlanticus TaxID=7932 RepID=A0A9D3PWD5_MEGAT|nr:hypothetical protein MATL_G00130640 [Megalops atlanticus]